MTFKWIVLHFKGEVAYELDMRWECLLKDGFFFQAQANLQVLLKLEDQIGLRLEHQVARSYRNMIVKGI